jgi:hypothetical protein
MVGEAGRGLEPSSACSTVHSVRAAKTVVAFLVAINGARRESLASVEVA